MSSMREEAERAAERILGSKSVLVVTHIDADGICAAALATMILDRARIKNDVKFLKKLDSKALDEIRKSRPKTVWFTDLGSGMLHELNGLSAVVSDHHVPALPPASARRDLVALAEATSGDVPHVNPHVEGREGGTDLSGAGAVYLVGKAISLANQDLAHLAVIGAVGDLQDRGEQGLTGTNGVILGEARKAGVVEIVRDVAFFGRETRPIHKLLQYASEPTLPGLAGDEGACINFLIDSGIKVKAEEKWRRWIDLSAAERKTLVASLRDLLEKNGCNSDIERDIYTLPFEERGTPVHEAKEYATMLNSCGRYGRGDVALQIARGDRGDAYSAGLDLQDGHRRNLVDFLQVVRDVGIEQREMLQFFDAGAMIVETVVGTVAGMALNSGLATRGLPIFAFAVSEDGIKVSARGTRQLVSDGMDLSEVMRLASEKVGGKGGGHGIAAGATIPPGKEGEFLDEAEAILRRQLRR